MKKLLLIILLSIPLLSQAQKLPNKQEGSLIAPATIKIDGKPTEWNNTFQAYNHATNFFYSMANSDDNLYLIIQATDPGIIFKVISGGITFTINKPGAKDSKDGVSVTYPIFDIKDKPNINIKDKPKIIAGSAISLKKADSFMYANNKRITAKSKYIKITGVKGLDTLLSIYNEDGIKAAELFDNKMAYTYELCIPLKYLWLAINDPVKFSYNIKSNGSKMDAMNGITITWGDRGEPKMMTFAPGYSNSKVADIDLALTDTDFSGEYTLAKKP